MNLLELQWPTGHEMLFILSDQTKLQLSHFYCATHSSFITTISKVLEPAQHNYYLEEKKGKEKGKGNT
jgi:hypothetical protein